MGHTCQMASKKGSFVIIYNKGKNGENGEKQK